MNTTPKSAANDTVAFADIPAAFHVGSDDVPFAEDFGAPGVHLKLLFADPEGGVFAVRIRFAPAMRRSCRRSSAATPTRRLS
jgi:hypothetical protein